MADNIPNLPGGAVPPKPETSKIQPKKETVRINLPPKPSAAPTIKLPTLPPGGPSTISLTPVPPPPTSAPRAAAAPVTSAPAQRPAAGSAAQQRPVSRPVAAPTVSGLDKGLAIAAAVTALAAIGVTVMLTFYTFTPLPTP